MSGRVMLLVTVAVFTANSFLPTVDSTTPYSRSLNDVGFGVIKHLGGQENLFISPVSIYTSLVTLYHGANGATKNQIEEALRIRYRGVPRSEMYMNTKYLIKLYSGSQDQYKLAMENGLFIQNGFQPKTTFSNFMKNSFRSTLSTVDFASKGEEAKEQINKWAAEKTQGLIHDFLQSPLDPSTVMVLLNAIYFKGTWQTEFNVSDTKEGLFRQPGNKATTVDFMELKNVKFDYYVDAETGYKFVEMPYNGGQQTMILGLPVAEDKVFPDLEMTEEILYRVTRGSRRTMLDRVVIPKFKLEYDGELTKALRSMGITDLFSDSADLSRISNSKLKISSILHKTVVEVNEKGSEAAAVTGSIIVPTSLIIPKREFVADRPFLFYILDFNTDIVLFAGRLVNP